MDSQSPIVARSGFSPEESVRWDEWQRASAHSARHSATQVRVIAIALMATLLVMLGLEILRSPAFVARSQADAVSLGGVAVLVALHPATGMLHAAHEVPLFGR